MEHVLVTICGRAGSKGFKNKNLKIFDGLPLSHYSLAAAKLFERQNPQLSVDICLNTDSELLINTVVEKYPEVSVLRRPQELCGDVVPKMMVYQHSLREMERRMGQRYAHLIDLDITSCGRSRMSLAHMPKSCAARSWTLCSACARPAARPISTWQSWRTGLPSASSTITSPRASRRRLCTI